jgi:hypothetical protein
MLWLGRWAQNRRHRGSATTALQIDSTGVQRELADGRTEAVHWASLTSIEVVCTPVSTADGAKAFVLLAESDSVGALVPLGIGHDDALLVECSRLRGFRLEAFAAAMQHRAPHREVVWRSTPTT